MSSLSMALAQALVRPAGGEDNVDRLRFSEGFAPPPTPRESARTASWALKHRRDLAWLKGRVIDESSRRTIDQVVAFRTFGRLRVELGVGARGNAALAAYAASLEIEHDTVDLEFLGWHANRYDLRPLGIDADIDVYPLGVVLTFLLEQYRHPEFRQANVRPGDVVIDGGACWGDTAICFSDAVGPEGRVVAFEFNEGNLRVLRDNLRRNPRLEPRVQVRTEALWSVSGEPLTFSENGPGSSVVAGSADAGVSSRSIDSLVDEGIVDRVDFIKLDVEGAEMDVLYGAAETIRRDRPRLAIAVYHRPEDLFGIPRLVDRLAGDGYRMAITHRWIEGEETMLFAWPA